MLGVWGMTRRECTPDARRRSQRAQALRRVLTDAADVGARCLVGAPTCNSARDVTFIDAARAGHFDVRFDVPAAWEVVEQGETSSTLVDAAAGVQWHLFAFPGVVFDLSDAGWPTLQRDVTQHADYLFDMMRRMEQASLPDGETLPPRPPRHPLVACQRVEVEGGRALLVLHRMVMRPGREIVMGHLLAPAAAGLFEVRWVCRSDFTGTRESVLLMKAMQDAPGDSPSEIDALMRSIDYDAPEHDATFPEHPLSVARAMGGVAQRSLRIVTPAAPVPTGESIQPALSLSFTPPPRFVQTSATKKSTLFRRYSLAGNDGEQVLGIELALVSTKIERLAASIVTQLGATPRETRKVGRIVVCDGTREHDEIRIALAPAALDTRKQALLQLVTTTAFPVEEIEVELGASAASVRAQTKPWWRFW